MKDTAQQLLILFISVLASGLLGFRAGIIAERRKEYNELADNMAAHCDVELKPHSATCFALLEVDVKQMRRRMGQHQRRRFDLAVERFRAASRDIVRDDAGQPFYADTDSVNAALRDIVKLVQRK